jgi:membrane-associated phospholipid phosphatase
MNKKIATVVSRIFDPFITLAVLFTLLFYGTTIFIPAFFLMIILPLILFFVAWKAKVVGNWDVSDRRERPKILWVLVVLEILVSILLGTTIASPVLIALVGFAVITQFWKISGHTMAAALATGIVISHFGQALWPVLLIVPIVGWARVVRKDHTITQVIAGAAYSWLLLVILDYLIIG